MNQDKKGDTDSVLETEDEPTGLGRPHLILMYYIGRSIGSGRSVSADWQTLVRQTLGVSKTVMSMTQSEASRVSSAAMSRRMVPVNSTAGSAHNQKDQ